MTNLAVRCILCAMEENTWTEEQLIAYVKSHGCPAFDARQLKRYRQEKLVQVEREYPDFGGSRSTYPPEAGPRAVEVYQLLREKRNFNVVRFQLWQRGQPIDLSLLKQSLLALAPIHRVPIPVRRSAFVERQVEAILQSLEKRIRYSEWRTVLKGLPSEEDRRDFLTMHVSFMAGAKYIFDPFLGDTINAYQRENRPGEFTTAEIFKRGLHLEDATFRHHPVCCVQVGISQEGDLRGYYRHRMFLLHSSSKTRRKLCLSPKSVPHRLLKRQKWSHRTTKCRMNRNFANGCEPLQLTPCGS